MLASAVALIDSPELLALDRTRQALEAMGSFSWGSFVGASSPAATQLAALQRRASVFTEALATRADDVERRRKGIRYSRVGIASLGLIHLLRRHRRTDDRNALLELAARDDLGAAGFRGGPVRDPGR
jgi:hypothetical protein